LRVFGREAGRLGVDVDLDRCHVREGIHRHLTKRLHAQPHDDEEGDEHENLVTQ